MFRANSAASDVGRCHSGKYRTNNSVKDLRHSRYSRGTLTSAEFHRFGAIIRCRQDVDQYLLLSQPRDQRYRAFPQKEQLKWQIKLLAASADEASARQARPENTKEIARENPDRFISPIAIHSIYNRAVLGPPFFPRNNLPSYLADRLFGTTSC
jgi:hypothetical protein